MLKVNDISFYIGNKELFDKCSLEINEGDKIGLVGENGAGKSTLMKLIIGELKPDEGSIILQKGTTLGFLNQDLLSYKTSESIKNVTMKAFDHVLELFKELEKISKEMETNYTDELYNQMLKITEEIEINNGYEIEAQTEKVLEGMGFKTSDLNRPLEEFSGGWRMRVMLAKLLLQNPSILMLDEPTNHLDIESIKWLEEYLKSYNGAFIVISHDRYFLDNITNKIIELENQKLTKYDGNYTSYETTKAKNIELQQSAYINQQKKIAQLQEFIDKYGAKASKAKQAKNIEKRIEKMDKVEAVNIKKSKINFNFNNEVQSGKIVVELNNIEKSYGDIRILDKSNGIICRNDKIALIGANGKGKSTLLKLIFYNNPKENNYEPLNAGEIKFGNNVKSAYYAQHQLESLNLENTIIKELIETNQRKPEEDIRRLCGMFLFKKDDINKKIRVLSGGEKARVALIKILLTDSNFLLLDEPTNHLDMKSIEILGQAIKQYTGTCIVVSHDRHFVDCIANKIWYIKDHVLKEYPGTYTEFISSKNI